METLFHELHTETFAALAALQNDLLRGTPLIERDMLARLPHVNWAKAESARALLRAVFHFDEAGRATPLVRGEIPFLPTRLELSFLKSLLTDEALRFLLPEPLRQKLAARLAGVPPLVPAGAIEEQCDKGDDLAALQPKLALYWQALTQQRQIYYTNIDRASRRHQSVASPCRLEYDAATHRVRAIVYLAEEHRAIKLNFRSLREITCLAEKIPAGTEAAFQAFLKSRARKVTLALTPKYNATARTFALFAPYDKEASYDEETGRYTLRIHYYDFDEEEITRQILTLGSAACVLSPAPFRAKIIARLKSEWELLKETNKSS